MNIFDPRIIAFCCTHCAYAAADLAGATRIQYPPNVRIINIPCSGKIDVLYILKSFEDGADAVLVAGCLEGTCHFIDGNVRAEKRVRYAKTLLDETGIEPERLEMYKLSSAMGRRFAEIIEEMTEKIRGIGPIYGDGE